MPFWSGETLKARLPRLVTDYCDKRVDCNAYTLRMGNEYFCTSDGRRSLLQRAKKQRLTKRDTFVIPAGQFAFLETLEQIEVPADAMAFISLKSQVKWDGIINVSGFHVDPGYKGKLIFSVYNAGPSSVVLEQGMPLFLIWFAALDIETSKEIRAPNSGKSISRDLIKRMSPEILSLQSLSREITKLRTSMRIQAIVFGFGAFLFAGIIVSITAYILQHGLQTILDAASIAQKGAVSSSAAGHAPANTTGSPKMGGPTAPSTQAPGSSAFGSRSPGPPSPPAHGTPNSANPASK